MNLEALLSDKDYGLRMRFERGEVAEFFKPGADHETVLAERRMWIARDPACHVALMPEGEAMLDETVELAASSGTLAAGGSHGSFAGRTPLERCRLLGESWEADFLLMKPDAQGIFRLYGGSLCFPSHWDLREKLGRPMLEIHAPVPGLNETLGRQIDGFLARIKPGISWERENWGLARTPELNLHPSRKMPRLDAGVGMHEVWLRVEEQSLVSLPESGGILFGIRLVIVPMREIHADPVARTGMIRALRTMPVPMADYKGITPARERLIGILEAE